MIRDLKNGLIYIIHICLLHRIPLLFRYCRVGIYAKHEGKEYIYYVLDVLDGFVGAELRKDSAYIPHGLSICNLKRSQIFRAAVRLHVIIIHGKKF